MADDDGFKDSPSTGENERRLARPSSVFERAPGNVYVLPEDEGTGLSDVSRRPTIVAPVELGEERAD